MGYRELSRMEMVEVVRRWQMGESQRAIACASGVARETVKKYVRAAEELGISGQWTAADRGPGGAAGSRGSGGERAADVGNAPGGSLGAVSRADHHVAAGGALA